MTHTPGPWLADHDCDIRTEAGTPIAYLAQTVAMATEEAEANARLIVAAPELLEALEALLREFNQSLPDARERERARKNARAAIARAKGEEVPARP